MMPLLYNRGFNFIGQGKKIGIIQDKKFSKLSIIFQKNKNENIKQFLKAKNYSDPKDNFYLYTVCVKRVLEETLWTKKNFINDDFELFLWKDLKEEERKNFIDIEKSKSKENCEFYGYFPPTNKEEFEEINSLGIRNKDGVIGWIITQKNSENTIAVSLLYVMKKYRNSTLSLGLNIEAFKRQVEVGIPNVSCIIHSKNKPMLNLYKKRFDFATLNVSQTVISEKILSK